MHETSIVMQEFECLADLQQSLLDLQLVDLKFPPSPRTIRILGHISAGPATDSSSSFLIIFLLEDA